MSMALSNRVLPADQWHRLPPGVPKLVVYTAFFYFSTMFFGKLASARHCIFRCFKLLRETSLFSAPVTEHLLYCLSPCCITKPLLPVSQVRCCRKFAL